MSEKIDITKYNHLNFAMAHQASMKAQTEFYRSGNYLSFIKQRCLSHFLMYSNFAFVYKVDNPSVEKKPFVCYQFPDSGKEHEFQAFKKLNLEAKIPDFNKCHTDFYKTIVPDWEKIQGIMTEHHNRWKSLSITEKMPLLETLHSQYKGLENSEIYYQYFIFENQYLHQQFDRFISTKDLNDWWEGKAVGVLQ